MNTFASAVVIVLQLLQLSTCQTCTPYNTIGTGHTMCKYAANSGCTKIVRGLNQTAINDILAVHNTLRQKVAKGAQPNQPGATNMKQLKWNSELATIAQRWADQCTFGHDGNRNTKTFSWVGQNAAVMWSTGKLDNAPNFKDQAIDPWFNEVTLFDKANISPFKFTSNTGHYSQVAWADTSDTGCGYSYYLQSGRYTKLYICNYGPGGNVQGPNISMYKIGTACTACTNGCSTTYPQLCN